jgi:alpha-glucosidase
LAYRSGEFLRIQFSCTQGANSVTVHIGRHEGAYKAWWSQFRVEVYGWNFGAPLLRTATSAEAAVTLDSLHHMVSVMVPDDGKGQELQFTSLP